MDSDCDGGGSRVGDEQSSSDRETGAARRGRKGKHRREGNKSIYSLTSNPDCKQDISKKPEIKLNLNITEKIKGRWWRDVCTAGS